MSDPNVEIVGYQVDFEELQLGLFLFNHSVCRTTLSIEAREFSDLHKGPVFSDRKTGTSDCPGHCMHRDDLEACPARCECAYIRETLQLVQTWPKC